MSRSGLGVVISAPDSDAILESIARAEELGIPAAWMTTGGAGLDALTLFAAASVSTQRIMLGTSITPTFPRHPVVIAHQVQVVGQLAPGRFRLGIGPSSQAGMQGTFGANFLAPLGHLREYVRILKALLQRGEVDFDGHYYRAHARIAAPMDVPVMASALGAKAFELCGAEADGAISWVCPGRYLRDEGVPAMKAGADKAGRPVPPLIAHAPVAVHENFDEVRAAASQQFGNFPKSPFYQRMFAAAGFPEAAQGTWSDDMIDAVVLWGNETRVMERLKELFSFGAGEVMASPISAGDDRAASLDRTNHLLARAASELAGG